MAPLSLYQSLFATILIIDLATPTQLPSSCIGQTDGYHWMKLIEDSPIVYQQCSNGYMVINPHEDPNIAEYFSSYSKWHYALAGPDLSDGANWEKWWLPNSNFNSNENSYFSYIISPDCSSCDLSQNIDENAMSLFNTDSFGDRTAYHMTGTIFGCQMPNKALKDCVWDYDTYQCNLCITGTSEKDLGYRVIGLDDEDLEYFESLYDVSSNGNVMSIGLCGVLPLASYDSTYIPQSRADCFDGTAYKPSIGTDGRHCVCVKPSVSTVSGWFEVKDATIESAQSERALYLKERDGVVDSGSSEDVIELWQTDFEHGTYRIQKSGMYQIMEDIIFDFNAGDLENPNEGDSWWPTMDQVDQYPGAGSTRDEYFMGFFAGITVEADDVHINLGEHTLAMSPAFYYQQRFFSIIALKSVAFPLNQGPGFFGMEPKFANNVVIKDGVIGLSSHHGIHGHYNADVTISNVHIRDFETHGVQMSYFQNLKMSNVEIGPSSKMAYLKGEYAYARWTVVQLERIMESGDYNDIFPITFSGRKDSLEFEDIISNLRDLMDMAFKYVMKVDQDIDDPSSWEDAQSLFINDDGLPYGAVMYGLFLNLWFANVFTIHPSTKHAEGAVLENVKIHELHHKTVEYQRLDALGTAMYRNQFNAPLDATALLGSQIYGGYKDIPWSKTKYRGNVLTDAEIVLSMVTDDWEELGLIFMENNFAEWALGQYSWPDDDETLTPNVGCNNDRMGHVPKGVIGIRMDGVEDVTFRDLTISNLHEESAKGSYLCSDYWDEPYNRFFGKGNTLQNAPYLYGYTGNLMHGIFSDFSTFSFEGDVQIGRLVCDTGLVRGIGMYRESHLTLADDSSLHMAGLSAGHESWSIDTDKFPHPYNPAVAKPFHVLWDSPTTLTILGEKEEVDFSSSIENAASEVTLQCVYGRDGVDDSYWREAIDNSDCADIEEDFGMEKKQESLTYFKEHGFPDLLKEETLTVDTAKTRLRYKSNSLRWSSIVGSVVMLSIIGVMFCIFGHSVNKKSVSTEIAPLLDSL